MACDPGGGWRGAHGIAAGTAALRRSHEARADVLRWAGTLRGFGVPMQDAVKVTTLRVHLPAGCGAQSWLPLSRRQ